MKDGTTSQDLGPYVIKSQIKSAMLLACTVLVLKLTLNQMSTSISRDIDAYTRKTETGRNAKTRNASH